MRELGYVEGKDFVIEWRFAEGKYERFAEFAAEFVQLKIDIFVLGTPVLQHRPMKSQPLLPRVTTAQEAIADAR